MTQQPIQQPYPQPGYPQPQQPAPYGAPSYPQPQQPAYPQQPQAYPQQQPYGQQTPPMGQGAPQQPGQPPLAQGTLDDYFNQPSAGTGPSVSWQNKPEGTTVVGTVARDVQQGDVQQETNPQGIPQTLRDGSPKFVMKVPLLVPPSPEHPDGEATWYVKGQARDELVRAMAEAGVPPGAPKGGATVEVKLTGRRQSRPGFNPANVFAIRYFPAQDGQPVQQATQQPVQQQAPAPQPAAQQQPYAAPQAAPAPAQPAYPMAPQPGAGAPPQVQQQAPAPQPVAQQPQGQQMPPDLSPEQQQLLAQLTAQQQPVAS